jgi:hypothetical protein
MSESNSTDRSTNKSEHEYLPECLFLSESQYKNECEYQETSNKSDNESQKFSCSTPIKFYLKDESTMESEEEGEQLNEANTSNSTINNDEANKVCEADTAKSECLVESRVSFDNLDISFIKTGSSEGARCANDIIKTNSLLEFEENEKILADQSLMSNFSTASDLSLMTAPIFQMENLISNLRENYNYKLNDSAIKVADAEASLNKTPTNNKSPKVNGVDIDSILSKMISQKAKVRPEKTTEKANNAKENGNHKNELALIENKLENEITRRQHCEKQIHELNERLLELQQQLAVAHDLGHKREVYAQTMDSALQKVTLKNIHLIYLFWLIN